MERHLSTQSWVVSADTLSTDEFLATLTSRVMVWLDDNCRLQEEGEVTILHIIFSVTDRNGKHIFGFHLPSMPRKFEADAEHGTQMEPEYMFPVPVGDGEDDVQNGDFALFLEPAVIV